MNYPNMKKHFGEERLKRELKFVEGEEWLIEGLRGKKMVGFGFWALKEIDRLIGENESIWGFKKWAKEVKKSKELNDCLFELICFDELSKNNRVIIKRKNAGKTPDAFLEDENIYVEMTNLESIPLSIELKVNDLCSKSQEKFGDSLGIHFIGINGFFEYSEKYDKLIQKQELAVLVEDLRKKLQRLDKNILCFILVHNYLNIHPDIGEFRWYREIPYIIFNEKVNWNLLKKIVGEFKIGFI